MNKKSWWDTYNPSCLHQNKDYPPGADRELIGHVKKCFTNGDHIKFSFLLFLLIFGPAFIIIMAGIKSAS